MVESYLVILQLGATSTILAMKSYVPVSFKKGLLKMADRTLSIARIMNTALIVIKECKLYNSLYFTILTRESYNKYDSHVCQRNHWVWSLRKVGVVIEKSVHGWDTIPQITIL